MIFDFCIAETQRLADLTGIRLDIESALNYCELHLKIDPEDQKISLDKLIQGELTRQGLSRAAIVTYGRCWGNGVRKALSDEIFIKLSPKNKIVHQQVIDIRNKWAAHSVNHFDEVKIYLHVNDQSEEKADLTISVNINSVAGFRQAFIIPMKSLCQELLMLIQNDIILESEKITEFARSLLKEKLLQRNRIDTALPKERTYVPTKQAPRFKPL